MFQSDILWFYNINLNPLIDWSFRRTEYAFRAVQNEFLTRLVFLRIPLFLMRSSLLRNIIYVGNKNRGVIWNLENCKGATIWMNYVKGQGLDMQ